MTVVLGGVVPRYFELVEGQSYPLQVLFILHPIDEVPEEARAILLYSIFKGNFFKAPSNIVKRHQWALPADHVGKIRKGVVGREDQAIAFFLTQNPLVTSEINLVYQSHWEILGLTISRDRQVNYGFETLTTLCQTLTYSVPRMCSASLSCMKSNLTKLSENS